MFSYISFQEEEKELVRTISQKPLFSVFLLRHLHNQPVLLVLFHLISWFKYLRRVRWNFVPLGSLFLTIRLETKPHRSSKNSQSSALKPALDATEKPCNVWIKNCNASECVQSAFYTLPSYCKAHLCVLGQGTRMHLLSRFEPHHLPFWKLELLSIFSVAKGGPLWKGVWGMVDFIHMHKRNCQAKPFCCRSKYLPLASGLTSMGHMVPLEDWAWPRSTQLLILVLKGLYVKRQINLIYISLRKRSFPFTVCFREPESTVTIKAVSVGKQTLLRLCPPATASSK